MSEKLEEKYCGMIGTNKYGTKMEIIKFNNQGSIVVKFLDSHSVEVHTSYGSFKSGSVKNPYDISVCGVGYIGDGKYKSKYFSEEKGKMIPTRYYDVWLAMIKRCYFDKEKELHPSYYHITTMCEEWKNFQVFAKWYEENFYELEGERVHLDKDILYPGNKVYSPETCIFVPQRINMLFMHKTKTIDMDLPNGITRSHLLDGRTRYRVMYNGKHFGTYDTVQEAYGKYIQAKKNAIIEVATEYRDKIPDRVYNALMEWKSEEIGSAA